ncbi:MAG: biopolymer transporter ExbD [Rhodocyclaceae bacterium]
MIAHSAWQFAPPALRSPATSGHARQGGRSGRRGADHDGDSGDLAEINMIPLIDVMLVLLVIFIAIPARPFSGNRWNGSGFICLPSSGYF